MTRFGSRGLCRQRCVGFDVDVAGAGEGGRALAAPSGFFADVAGARVGGGAGSDEGASRVEEEEDEDEAEEEEDVVAEGVAEGDADAEVIAGGDGEADSGRVAGPCMIRNAT